MPHLHPWTTMICAEPHEEAMSGDWLPWVRMSLAFALAVHQWRQTEKESQESTRKLTFSWHVSLPPLSTETASLRGKDCQMQCECSSVTESCGRPACVFKGHAKLMSSIAATVILNRLVFETCSHWFWRKWWSKDKQKPTQLCVFMASSWPVTSSGSAYP